MNYGISALQTTTGEGSCYEIDARLRPSGNQGVLVTSMHPGWADTPGVRRSLPRFFKLTQGVLRTPDEGADTIVWLAASDAATIRCARRARALSCVTMIRALLLRGKLP